VYPWQNHNVPFQFLLFKTLFCEVEMGYLLDITLNMIFERGFFISLTFVALSKSENWFRSSMPA
jgi:hypothetical protein